MDRARVEGGVRIGLVVLATACAACGLPTPITTVAVVLAALAAAEPLTRRRRLGWWDAVLVGTAGALITLVLLGLVLDLLPPGLARVPWALGAGACAGAAVLFGGRGGTAPRGFPRVVLTALRRSPWYVGAALVAVVAIVISVRATDIADRAPVELALVGPSSPQSARVDVSGGDSSTRYRLMRSIGRRTQPVGASFTVPGDRHVRRIVALPAGRRVLIRLMPVSGGAALRTLVVNPASSTSPVPPTGRNTP